MDGAIGSITWNALFNAEIPVPSLFSKPIDYRCLALTGAFETDSGFPDCFAGLSGDFDGQGISFGTCQWNFGQDSLQPLLRDMIRQLAGLAPDLPREALEVEKMKIIAYRRAEAAHPRWVEDVRARKLCIAKGEGMVHSIRYNLEEQFGIQLK